MESIAISYGFFCTFASRYEEAIYNNRYTDGCPGASGAG